jgi:hypothetical protein
MKRKTILVIASAATCLMAAIATPGYAKPAATWQYPKWYYYDQLGLQLWNKGEHRKAVEQFKYAKRICETSTRMPPGGFDARTKRLIKDLIDHNMLQLTVEDQEAPKLGNNADAIARMEAQVEEENRRLDKKIEFYREMKRFVQRFVGQKVHLASDMDQRISGIEMNKIQNLDTLQRYKTGNHLVQSPVNESQRVTDNKGVAIPKWFRSGSSRYGEAGHEKERKSDAQFERGVSYKSGQRYEEARQTGRSNTGTWGGDMGKVDNPNLKSHGWGSGETSGPQRAKNMWGQEREDLDINKKRPPKGWGESNTPKETVGSGWGSGSNWGEPVQEGQSPNSTPGSTSDATGQPPSN